jgi:hypothetical protein
MSTPFSSSNLHTSKQVPNLMLSEATANPVQPRKILFSEHFIDNNMRDSDRINTVLDETFQMTVR